MSENVGVTSSPQFVVMTAFPKTDEQTVDEEAIKKQTRIFLLPVAEVVGITYGGAKEATLVKLADGRELYATKMEWCINIVEAQNKAETLRRSRTLMSGRIASALQADGADVQMTMF